MFDWLKRRWIRKFQYESVSFQIGYETISRNPILAGVIGRFVDTHCRESEKYERKLRRWFGFEDKDLDRLYRWALERKQKEA